MEQQQTSVTSGFSRFRNLLAGAGFDWFMLALIGMIVLAYFLPEPGVQEGPLSLGELAGYGVTLIFFFYGLRLNPAKLKAGLSNWRLHLLVHVATFVIFPLLIIAMRPLVDGDRNELLWLGVFYLAALPSTVSSSVVMVSIAGGNILAAIFNASVSSLIGVFVTPLWMGLFLSAVSGEYDIAGIIGKLMLQVLAPVLLGMALNRRFGGLAEQHRKKMRYFDQVIILLIVYTSFCESFALNMFAGYSSSDILVLAALMVGLFFLIYFVIYGISHLLRFNREDRITALFCGSKKSLVQGTVMSKVLFPDPTIVGVVLLPIMLYHALQLLAASMIAQSLARRAGLEVKGE